MNKIDSYVKIALEATKRVAIYLSQQFQKTPTLVEKEPSHFGTLADKKASDLYHQILSKKTPEAGIYDEEAERNLSQNLTWVIDPLEGTTNFCTGIPFFGTQLALLHNQKVVLGVIRTPITNDVYYAIKGKGAFLNNKSIHVNTNHDSKIALLLVGKGHGDQGLEFVRKMIKISGKKMRNYRVYGATGPELALVAQGKADILCNSSSELYDYAPGVIITQEAGGITRELSGKPWSIQSRSLIAGNSNLVNKLLTLITD